MQSILIKLELSTLRNPIFIVVLAPLDYGEISLRIYYVGNKIKICFLLFTIYVFFRNWKHSYSNAL